MGQRKIIHIDADSFYASVEMREDAYLRLLHSAWQRHGRAVRLLGAGLRLEPQRREGNPQLNLFGND